MHRQHATFRQQVVQDAKDGFLDFTGIARAADQNHLLRKIDDDEDFRIRPVDVGYRLEVRRVQDGELGNEVAKLVAGGLDEHVTGEKAVPGRLRHHADVQLEGRIRAGVAVLNEQLLAFEIGEHALVKRLALRLVDGPVDLAPVDVSIRPGLFREELVVRRATRVDPGMGDQRPTEGEHAFAAPDRFFV